MNELIKKIHEKINEYDTIIIHRHRSPDLDAIGSQLALKDYLKLNYNKRVFAAGTSGFNEFNYIGSIDVLDRSEYENSLVIIVDTANKERIEDENYLRAKEIIKIDHHPDVEAERYGTINYIDSTKSSTCELLYEVFEGMIKNYDHKLNSDIARKLFCGIYGDTGGFIFPNTTSNTFKVLSEILKFDFDYEEIIMNLRVYDEDIMRIIGWSYQNIVIKNGIGHIVFTSKMIEDFKIHPRKLSLVANFMGNIKSLKAWVIFIEYDKFIRANIRSRKDYPINTIAEQFNGGGHPNASGAMVKTQAEIDEIINRLNSMV